VFILKLKWCKHYLTSKSNVSKLIIIYLKYIYEHTIYHRLSVIAKLLY